MVKVLAFDFGASSGRAILAEYQEGRLAYREVHRFENNPITQQGQLCWDFPMLLDNVHAALRKAGQVDSIGFDTWGVDFGLLDAEGKLLANPVHYRDSRTQGMVTQACTKLSAPQLYAATGNQLMELNTLFQLLALQQNQPQLLAQAKTLLFMPDLLGYMLTGSAACERTIASTSQMLNPVDGQWSREVLETFGLHSGLLLPPVASGTATGRHQGARVVAVAGHDTQCAVAAMPARTACPAFLSCGTWSLLGCELDAPILTEESLALNLSNELGVGDKVNYLKNIIGLWLIQESRREWKRQGQDYSYAQLEQLALAEAPLRCFIDPDDPAFSAPGDLPARVADFCTRTGQTPPQTVGQTMRCIYESLALKYRYAIAQLQTATGKLFDTLHILGGGTKDGLLCRMTADCCGIPVVAGPIEATALGNIIIQLVALGELPNLEAGRDLIRQTEAVQSYIPKNTQAWDKAYQQYIKFID